MAFFSFTSKVQDIADAFDPFLHLENDKNKREQMGRCASWKETRARFPAQWQMFLRFY